MEERLIFNEPDYWLMFALLMFGRGMDLFSTRVATPRLLLEGNLIANLLGWRIWLIVNVILCFGIAFLPLYAIAGCTMSVLTAASNFQMAWLIRTMGEESYVDWFVKKTTETNLGFYLFCLFFQTGLIALVGGALSFFSTEEGETWLIPFAVGIGIVGYALMVLVYTLLALRTIRRSARKPKR